MNELDFGNKQVLVVGGSSGIGNGIAHNGNAITFEGIDVIDCNEEGKIVRVRAFWDPGPVMAALQG